MSLRLLLAVALVLTALPLFAADWPQWRGPERDDISKETGLLKNWAAKKPAWLWTYTEAGVGYSGPAVVSDRLFTMGADKDGQNEFVFCLDVNTGKRLWTCDLGPMLTNGYGDGPRGTPTVDGELLYAISGRGNLVCVETASGTKRWQKSLINDLGGEVPNWGYTESPLVDGDHVVCTPGGNKGSLAALDKKTGDVIWQSRDIKDTAAYSSMIVAEVDGVRQYIQMLRRHEAGVAAKDGKVLWQNDLVINSTATIPTPIYADSFVYLTSGYQDRGGGCALLKLTHDGGSFQATAVYNNKNMVNHHGGVVKVGDYVYGYSDSQRGRWICQEFKTGKVVWESTALGKGSLTCADGMLYCYSQDGDCVLVEASPADWKAHGRFPLPQKSKLPRQRGMIWTHPVVANGRLYLRDLDLIFCFDVSASRGR